MKKLLCFLMIVCCMIPLFCAVPAMAEEHLAGAPEPGLGTVQYPLQEYLNLWKVEGYAADRRGFEFSIQISDRLKEYTFQSKDDMNPSIAVVEWKTPNFKWLNLRIYLPASRHISLPSTNGAGIALKLLSSTSSFQPEAAKLSGRRSLALLPESLPYILLI